MYRTATSCQRDKLPRFDFENFLSLTSNIFYIRQNRVIIAFYRSMLFFYCIAQICASTLPKARRQSENVAMRLGGRSRAIERREARTNARRTSGKRNKAGRAENRRQLNSAGFSNRRADPNPGRPHQSERWATRPRCRLCFLTSRQSGRMAPQLLSGINSCWQTQPRCRLARSPVRPI